MVVDERRNFAFLFSLMKYFLSLLSTVAIAIPLAFASTSVSTLYDQTVELKSCVKTTEKPCQKNFVIEQFIPDIGWVGIYVKETADRKGQSGGIEVAQLFFENEAGDRTPFTSALQIFERGTVVLDYPQSVTGNEWFPASLELKIFFLPHEETAKRSLILRRADDEEGFEDYVKKEEFVVSPLCTALKSAVKVPIACGDVGVRDLSTSPSSDTTPGSARDDREGGAALDDNTFRSDPLKLPELDFSGKPTRPPVITIRPSEQQVFVNEPVTIKVTEVYDPDGKCGIFEYEWKKPKSLEIEKPSLDRKLGDLFFVPKNTGVFLFSLRVRETCQELGKLISAPAKVRLTVNDKARGFSDVMDAPQYENAIYTLYHEGSLRGYGDGTVRPNAPINRAEFLKMVFETLKFPIDKTVFSPRYSDVSPDAWFAPYVSQADLLGVIKGYPDGKFHPERTVNLVEALKIVLHFTTIDILDTEAFSFPDVETGSWYSRYVQTAFREGILDLQPGKRVRPGETLSRGKASELIVRTFLYPVNRINQVNKDVLRRPDEFQDFSEFTK